MVIVEEIIMRCVEDGQAGILYFLINVSVNLKLL